MAGYTPNCYRLDQVGRELGERKDTYSSLCHLVSVKWGITISILLERENVATEGGERTKQSAHYKFALTRMHVWVRASIRPSYLHFWPREKEEKKWKSRTNKVATDRHVYWSKPKEPTQFGSVSGSEIQHLPFSHSGIVSLYRSEPKEPT